MKSSDLETDGGVELHLGGLDANVQRWGCFWLGGLDWGSDGRTDGAVPVLTWSELQTSF